MLGIKTHVCLLPLLVLQSLGDEVDVEPLEHGGEVANEPLEYGAEMDVDLMDYGEEVLVELLEHGVCCNKVIPHGNESSLYMQLKSATPRYCFCVRLLCDKQIKDSTTWEQNNKRNKELRDEEFLNVPICSSCRIIYDGVPLESVTYCEGQIFGEVTIEDNKFKLDGDEVQLEKILNSNGDSLKQLEVNNKDGVEDDVKPFVVEILIATDETVSVYYEEEELATYLKTVVDKASDILSDSSLGTDLVLALRHIVHLNDQHTFRNSPIFSTSEALQVFCGWQEKYGSANSLSYDIAILLTRTDLCYNSSSDSEVCLTLGFAHRGVMCDKSRSCAIVQDNGLMAAHTISHEIGHTLGAGHGDNSSIHVMSPILHGSSLAKWSSKSRKQIGKFLESSQADCLTNTSEGGARGPVGVTQLGGGGEGVPVGALYNADQQCRLKFGGDNMTVCDSGMGEEEFCVRLWCFINQTCASDGVPPADGTMCGTRKWCIHGKCVSIQENKDSVDGSWGDWLPWSSCSTTCGGGIMSSKRECDNPIPRNDGRYCLGQHNRHRVCSKIDCPSTSLPHRTIQCKALTNITDSVHVDDYSQPCVLFCRRDVGSGDKTRRSSEFWEHEAKDGTPCSKKTGEGARDMCIFGKCVKVGCDWVLGSNTVTDRCGVCGGDGSLCEEITGEFEDTGTENEYVEITSIPEGARRIHIKMQGSPNNLLSIVGDESGKSYLNWDWVIQWPGEYDVGGTLVVYTRGLHNQSVYIESKSTETFVVFLLRQSLGSSVSWSFIMPFRNATYQVTYSWHMSPWTICDSTCGGGVQFSQPICQQDSLPGVAVRSQLCEDGERPDALQRSCGNSPCPPAWWLGPWQSCSQSCGGFRQRTVLCINHKMGALLDRMCSDQPKPESIQECQCTNDDDVGDVGNIINKEDFVLDDKDVIHEVESKLEEDSEDGSSDTGYFLADEIGSGQVMQVEQALHVDHVPSGDDTNGWTFGNWSQCSKLCGTGIMQREVVCLHLSCPHDEKPLEQSPCELGTCNEWTVGAWMTCSTLCGPGIMERKVGCTGVCDPETRPSETKSCNEGPCSVWWSGPWSQCNATCGSGLRFRNVECRHSVTEIESTGCEKQEKPPEKIKCDNIECKTTRKPNNHKMPLINANKVGTAKNKVTRTSQRCRDSLKSNICFNFRHLCNKQILFSKKCCQTCFKIYKMRRLQKRFNKGL